MYISQIQMQLLSIKTLQFYLPTFLAIIHSSFLHIQHIFKKLSLSSYCAIFLCCILWCQSNLKLLKTMCNLLAVISNNLISLQIRLSATLSMHNKLIFIAFFCSSKRLIFHLLLRIRLKHTTKITYSQCISEICCKPESFPSGLLQDLS